MIFYRVQYNQFECITKIDVLGAGLGVIPINFLSSRNHDSKNNSTESEVNPFLSLKSRSLLSALDSLGSSPGPNIKPYGDHSTALFFPGPSAVVRKSVIARSNIAQHQGKYGTTRNLKQIFLGA